MHTTTSTLARALPHGLLASLVLVACGGEEGRQEEGGEVGVPPITISATQGSATEGDEVGQTEGGTVGSASASATMGSATDPDGTGPTVYFDVGAPDGGASCGTMGDGETHSYIWIANSAQGTVSKTDTVAA